MIGMLTFHWADDYGALLQCYALKTYLSRYEETIVIPYSPKALYSRYCLVRCPRYLRLTGRVWSVLDSLRPGRFCSRWLAKRRIAQFRAQHLTSDRRRLLSAQEIVAYRREIRTYLVGSDQVWNPDITEGFQDGYFCTFRAQLPEGVRCVAYAASTGQERLDTSCDAALTEYLKNFDVISIREQGAVPYLESLCGVRPEVMLDPVFLLGKQEWERLLPARKRPKERYIVVYDTVYNEEMALCLKNLREKLGFPVVVVLHPMMERYCWGADRYAAGCGVEEFLELLHGAEYMVTNSFHGAAMSLILHKQFVAFRLRKRNARIENILQIAGQAARLVSTAQEGERMLMEPVNWTEADALLETERMRAKAFLREHVLVGGG